MIKANRLMEDTGEGAKIPVGIHGDVNFLGLKKDTTWWDILFVKPATRQTIHKRLFQPTGEYTYENETPEEAYNREVDNNLKHVVHLLREFLGDESTSQLEAPDYEAFVEMAADYLDQFIGEQVWLKVIPDRKGKYPDLGRYPNYVERFVEGMETTLKFTKKEGEAVAKYYDTQDGGSSDSESVPTSHSRVE